ncbi:hypothetical protein LPTSP4_29640 [Leptospira ryugenii]|uniref:Lipoprotein n=1 Tax=Leptospira ryugenii TaxID=1917863 RepID=A0A2P2E3G5_9LEPT|nr:hypothetical protein [Leptospira ryugenii]GBF51428.1 hypothetical protein LPTSP4_29640 [Leptospira ryugenii]
MKHLMKKVTVMATVMLVSLNLINCPKDKDDNTGLLLAALLFLNQPEYTVTITGILHTGSNGAPANTRMRDGLIKLSGGSGALVETTTIQDGASCATNVASHYAINNCDYLTSTSGSCSSNSSLIANTNGEFTINFRINRADATFDIEVLRSNLASVLTATTNSCSATGSSTSSPTASTPVPDFSADALTNSQGRGTLTVRVNESNLTSKDQVSVTTDGFGVRIDKVVIVKKGTYNLESPTVGEQVCDGNRLSGSPTTKSGTISASETWSGGILLSGTVSVNNGAVITVEPGTVIFGQRGSSLFFTGGASLISNGSAESPVCFTSAATPGSRFPGDWGGIVLVGNGFNSRNSAGQTEGTTPVAYPGSSNSNSRLRYTIIEFAGNEVAPGDELNNLSMYSVDNSGSGAALQYVQTHRGLDDSFEWWGGTISGSYLVATGGLDDDFDADEGYGVNSSGTSTATLTNLIALKYPSACGGSFSTDPHSFEMDGTNSGTGRQTCVGTNGADPTGTSCLSNPTVSNFTIIGQNQVGGSGMRLREGMRGSFSNGLIWNFAGPAVECTNNSGFPNSGVTMANTVYAGQSGAVTNAGAATCNNVQATLTALPITALGNVADSGCGFGATKPDFAAISGAPNRGAQNSDTSRWWSGWTVYRAR